MSAEEMWDAIAQLAATVPGIKAAHAAKASASPDISVKTWPEDIVDGPVALIEYAGPQISHGSFETLMHSFDIDLWVPSPDGQRAAAVHALAPLLAQVLNVFCQNTNLLNTCTVATITEASGLGDNVLNEKPYLVQSIRIEALEALNLTHRGGP